MKTEAKLDFEMPRDMAFDAGINTNAYKVTVVATDPSGATTAVEVTINVQDVNEAPEFDSTDTELASGDPAALTVVEKTTGLDRDPDTVIVEELAYTAVDVDDGAPTLTYGLEGADKDFFTIGNTEETRGVLSFAEDHTPDYETQKSYSITITASDGKLTGRLDVIVTVTNAEDDGMVMLSQLEPQVGRSVTATVSDQDGGVSGTSWQWYREDPRLLVW